MSSFLWEALVSAVLAIVILLITLTLATLFVGFVVIVPLTLLISGGASRFTRWSGVSLVAR